MNLFRRIVLYYLMAIGFSWPVLFLVDGRLIPRYHAASFLLLIALFGHMVAMMGPMSAGVIVLRYFKRGPLLNWKKADKRYYL